MFKRIMWAYGRYTAAISDRLHHDQYVCVWVCMHVRFPVNLMSRATIFLLQLTPILAVFFSLHEPLSHIEFQHFVVNSHCVSQFHAEFDCSPSTICPLLKAANHFTPQEDILQSIKPRRGWTINYDISTFTIWIILFLLLIAEYKIWIIRHPFQWYF